MARFDVGLSNEKVTRVEQRRKVDDRCRLSAPGQFGNNLLFHRFWSWNEICNEKRVGWEYYRLDEGVIGYSFFKAGENGYCQLFRLEKWLSSSGEYLGFIEFMQQRDGLFTSYSNYSFARLCNQNRILISILYYLTILWAFISILTGE